MPSFSLFHSLSLWIAKEIKIATEIATIVTTLRKTIFIPITTKILDTSQLLQKQLQTTKNI